MKRKHKASPPKKIQTNHMKGWGLVSSVTAVSKAMEGREEEREGGRKGEGRREGGEGREDGRVFNGSHIWWGRHSHKYLDKWTDKYK